MIFKIKNKETNMMEFAEPCKVKEGFYKYDFTKDRVEMKKRDGDRVLEIHLPTREILQLHMDRIRLNNAMQTISSSVIQTKCFTVEAETVTTRWNHELF